MEYEHGSAEALTYRYVHGLAKLSANISPVERAAGDLIEGGEVRLYHHGDRMGSSRYLSSGKTGKVASWTAYDEWGQITHNTVLKCGLRELDLVQRYTNHDYDAVLGVYYAKARLYDAQDKRFLAVDINRGYLVNPQTLALYTYCLNNPLKYYDPDGRKFTLVTSDGVEHDVGYVVQNGSIYVSMFDLADAFGKNIDVKMLTLISTAANSKTKDIVAEMWIEGVGYFNVLNCFDESRPGMPFLTYQSTLMPIGLFNYKKVYTDVSDVYYRLDNALAAFDYAIDTVTEKQGDNTSILLMAGAIALADTPAPGLADVIALIIAGIADILIAPDVDISVSVKFLPTSKAEEEIKTKTPSVPNPTFIYRSGSGNATNLTPRVQDTTGLSYGLTPPFSGEFTVTSVELVNSTGILCAIKDGFNHVSVVPANFSSMSEWIDSRAKALTNPHPYTLLLQSISIKVKL